MHGAKYIPLFVFLGLLTIQPVHARPSQEETAAFFAQQRKDEAAFQASILEETNSRTAAIKEFNDKAQTERVAFVQSAASLPRPKKARRLEEFGAAARQSQNEFRQKISTQDDIAKKKLKFKQDQAQKTRDFLKS